MTVIRGPLIAAVLLVLAGSVSAEDDAYERFVSGARSDRTERRRAALESVRDHPEIVPDDRRDRAVRLMLHILEKDREPDLRGLAARALAAFRSTETDMRIVQRLVAERDWRAQRGMMAALEGLTDEAVVQYLEKQCFREPRPDVQALWIEALGMCDSPRAPDVLAKLAAVRLRWPAAQATAIGLARHSSKTAVDRLVGLMWSDDVAVRSAAYESLLRLTGQRRFPAEAAAWVEWWGENRETFQLPKPRVETRGEVETVPAEPGSVPTYYDIPIRGRRVVFCLDVSASMWGPKFDTARKELDDAIRSLRTNQRFNVIFFNEHPHPWAADLAPAYPYQKLDCVATFEELETKKFTNIFDTLEMALGFAGIGRYARADPPGVDDVFILTDGEPNRGRRKDTKGILAGLAELDPKRRVRIHTISVGDDPKDLMAKIAAQQGGRHHHIEARTSK